MQTKTIMEYDFSPWKRTEVEWKHWVITNVSSKLRMRGWKMSAHVLLWKHKVMQLSEGKFWQYLVNLSREGNGTPLQYFCLENPMDGGAWWAAVREVSRSRTWLSNFTFTFHFHALEKEMATHSSVLAWRIPGMGKPGGLLSLGSHRVGHNWSDLAAAM